MAATTKLIVYNDALRELGSHPLANTSTANTRLQELDGAFNHAIEYLLSRADWNFARRRASLTGLADTSFPPFTYRYSRPSDYLRKLWIRTAATADLEIEHAEIGAVFYGYEATALLEYVSDTADNYDPANWPPHFTRCAVVYLALLVAPKLARAGADDASAFYSKLDRALADAERIEAVYTANDAVPADRQPIMRRALEIIGQSYDGSVALSAQAGRLRIAMNRAWDDCISFVLEQAAWNFAAKRAVFESGALADDNIPSESVTGITEGYSVDPDTSSDVAPAIAGYDYSYPLPSDFLHKVWIKASVYDCDECDYQRLGGYFFVNHDPCIMEYIAKDDFTTDPANWPYTFRETVSARLAWMVSPELVIEDNGKGGRVTASNLRDKLDGYYMRSLATAKNKDAMQQAVKVIPPGSFVRARIGGSSTLRLR